MISKYWRKIGLFILIIACLFNITYKIVHKASLKTQLEASAKYIQEENKIKFNITLEKKKQICYAYKQQILSIKGRGEYVNENRNTSRI